MKENEPGFSVLNRPPEEVKTVGVLDRISSTLDKDLGSDTVAERTARDFWDNAIYASDFFAADYTVTTGTDLRLSQTDYAGIIEPSRDTYVRIGAYLTAVDDVTLYITVLVSEETASLVDPITSNDRAYVGVKIISGVVWLVSRDTGGDELLVETNVNLASEYRAVFEFKVSGNQCSVLFNEKPIGSIRMFVNARPAVATGALYTYYIYLNNQSASSTTLVTTTYQFLQSRK